MNAKRAAVIAATLTALLSLALPAYAGPVTSDQCISGGGSVFTNANGSPQCSGGTYHGSLVV
jgi:hypothetical protein